MNYEEIKIKNKNGNYMATPMVDVTSSSLYEPINKKNKDNTAYEATPVIIVGGGGGGTGTEIDPIYTSDKPNIEKNHSENTTNGEITLTNGNGETAVTYNKATIDTKNNEILSKFQSVVINNENLGPVTMNGTPTKIIELDPILTSGQYKGAMRATFDGTGNRTVTVEIYINGIPTGKTSVDSVSDNQTINYQTINYLELSEGDIVSVYSNVSSGSVIDIEAILELIIGTGGTIDLSGLEKDHTEINDIVTLTNSIDETTTLYNKDKTDELIRLNQRIFKLEDIGGDVQIYTGDPELIFAKSILELKNRDYKYYEFIDSIDDTKPNLKAAINGYLGTNAHTLSFKQSEDSSYASTLEIIDNNGENHKFITGNFNTIGSLPSAGNEETLANAKHFIIMEYSGYRNYTKKSGKTVEDFLLKAGVIADLVNTAQDPITPRDLYSILVDQNCDYLEMTQRIKVGFFPGVCGFTGATAFNGLISLKNSYSTNGDIEIFIAPNNGSGQQARYRNLTSGIDTPIVWEDFYYENIGTIKSTKEEDK